MKVDKRFRSSAATYKAPHKNKVAVAMSHLLSPDDWSYPVPTTFGSAPAHQGSTNIVALPAVIRGIASIFRQKASTWTRTLPWKGHLLESFYPAFFARFNELDSPHLPVDLGAARSGTPEPAKKGHFHAAATGQSECLNKLLMAVHA